MRLGGYAFEIHGELRSFRGTIAYSSGDNLGVRHVDLMKDHKHSRNAGSVWDSLSKYKHRYSSSKNKG
jgi:hypothetical protein